DPTTFGNQLVLDEHRQAWTPCHLLDRTIFIEPCGRGYRLVPILDRRNTRIDASCWPRFARRYENEIVLRQIGDEIVELNYLVTRSARLSIASPYLCSAFFKYGELRGYLVIIHDTM